MKYAILGGLSGVVTIAVILWIVNTTTPRAPIPKWDNGDMVRSILTNQRGQVIGLRCYSGNRTCYYEVRFVGLSITTHTHITSPDGDISTEPLTAIDYVREYELKND
jgi:hypothetical protein